MKTIIGQGLAGTCLAWALWERGEDCVRIDAGGGSSRIAAGMINPLTGKNFEPSWRIAEFLPEALEFYETVGRRIGRKLWHPIPVLRLAGSEKEWRKMSAKLADPAVAPWVAGEVPAPAGWVGAVDVRGGGRLDVAAFLDGSREFFGPGQADPSGERIHCEGATGLLTGACGPHRCAKGEILTVRADGWDGTRIRIGAGGWLVPLGSGVFKVGSTYEWDALDDIPTARGRERIEEIARQLGGPDFQITRHDAGIRPILRRSQPLIGPLAAGGWMFNGLGSKGALYAPGMARRLADWLLTGAAPEAALDFREFLKQSDRDGPR